MTQKEFNTLHIKKGDQCLFSVDLPNRGRQNIMVWMPLTTVITHPHSYVITGKKGYNYIKIKNILSIFIIKRANK